jgi:hypothetical protein
MAVDGRRRPRVTANFRRVRPSRQRSGAQGPAGGCASLARGGLPQTIAHVPRGSLTCRARAGRQAAWEQAEAVERGDAAARAAALVEGEEGWGEDEDEAADW